MAPLAREDTDASVRLLIDNRAIQYLPVLSRDSLADRDFMDRCGAAGPRDGLVFPCWSESVLAAMAALWMLIWQLWVGRVNSPRKRECPLLARSVAEGVRDREFRVREDSWADRIHDVRRGLLA